MGKPPLAEGMRMCCRVQADPGYGGGLLRSNCDGRLRFYGHTTKPNSRMLTEPAWLLLRSMCADYCAHLLTAFMPQNTSRVQDLRDPAHPIFVPDLYHMAHVLTCPPH